MIKAQKQTRIQKDLYSLLPRFFYIYATAAAFKLYPGMQSEKNIRSHFLPLYIIVPVLLFLAACSGGDQKQSAFHFFQEHVTWLADDAREGRLAGSAQEAAAANYIEGLFLQFGLEPAGDDNTYLQHFRLTGPMPQAMQVENHLSRNVAGLVRGTEYPDRYIIVGAHYDGQGNGGIISMNHGGEPDIHNSADDNASGTAGLLWLAKETAADPLPVSVIFVAFSGEELGLLGSRYYAAEMEMPRDSVLAMINLDMIGRLEGRDLTIFGTGTSDAWEGILDEVRHDSLTIRTSSSGSGASDHASFYEAGIPVLHYFSGTHDDYHRETDTAEKIDYRSMEWIIWHAAAVIRQVSAFSPGEMNFLETEGERPAMMPADGVSLGVIPDYAYPGEGFRIESVRGGSVAERAGIRGGDVIVKMKEEPVADIYAYMQLLGSIEPGSTIPVVVRRDDEEIEISVTFN
jgi:acetylornithine deacetylase/succinyl-diaminopimelate desuccinylase-like protein